MLREIMHAAASISLEAVVLMLFASILISVIGIGAYNTLMDILDADDAARADELSMRRFAESQRSLRECSQR